MQSFPLFSGHFFAAYYCSGCYYWMCSFFISRGNRSCGYCLDPSVHSRWIHLHRDRFRNSRAFRKQQVFSDYHGNRCLACWCLYDGFDRRVRVKIESKYFWLKSSPARPKWFNPNYQCGPICLWNCFVCPVYCQKILLQILNKGIKR